MTTAAVKTDSAGHATAAWTLGTTVGTNLLLATTAGADPAMFTAYGATHPANGTVDQQVHVDSGAVGIVAYKNLAVYTTLLRADEIARIDPVTASVVRTIPTNGAPVDVAIDPSGTNAYIGDTSGIIQVLSLPVEAYAGTLISLFESGGLRRVFADSAYVYATSGHGTVTALIPQYDRIAYTVTVGTLASPIVNGITHHPTQPLLYVTTNGTGHGVLAEIDTRTGQVLRSLTLTGIPQDVAIDANGQTLYVADEAGGVYVIDQATFTTTGYVSLAGANPFGLAITPDNAQVYVVSSLGQIDVIDRVSQVVSKTIPVPAGVRRVAFNRDGTAAFVSNEAGPVLIIR